MRIAFDRPEVRNAFRPHTVDELATALEHARTSADVGVVLLTGNGPSPRDGGHAFCSGGDQRIRGRTGYQYAAADTEVSAAEAGRAGRLHILECQRLIRFMPKVVHRGGERLGRRRRALAARGLRPHPGLGRARALQADRRRRRLVRRRLRLGLSGAAGRAEVRPGDLLPRPRPTTPRRCTGWARSTRSCRTPSWSRRRCSGRARSWASPRRRSGCSSTRSTSIDDGLVGQQLFAGETTRLAYMTDEAVEGKESFLEKRAPDWSPFPWYY